MRNRIAAYLHINPTPSNFRDALAQLRAAQREAAAAQAQYSAAPDDHGDRRRLAAIHAATKAEIVARERLHSLVVAKAGPVPAAVQVYGTLVVAGLDEYGEVPDEPILTVIAAHKHVVAS